MKRFATVTMFGLLMSLSANANSINLQDTGWNLLGASQDVNLSKINGSCVQFMWKYDTNASSGDEWQLYVANGNTYDYNGTYMTSLNEGEGFWAYSNTPCDVNLSNADTSSSQQTYPSIQASVLGARLTYDGITQGYTFGHNLYWVDSNTFAYFSIKSSDAGYKVTGVDNTNTSGAESFVNFKNALNYYGIDLNATKLNFGESNLGNDTEGSDWSFNSTTAVETRNYYGVGDYNITVNGTAIVGGSLPNSVLTLDYSAVLGGGNITMTSVSDYTTPQNLIGAGGNEMYNNLANAFLNDISGYQIRFKTDSTDAIIQQDGTFNTTNTYIEVGQ